MRAKINFGFLFATLLLLGSCNDDPDPVIENEEELITTVRLAFTNGSTSTVAEWKDADGDGANPPVVDAIELEAGVTYSVSLELLNETTSPPDDITVEVSEEGADHQFFFIVEGGLDLTTAYNDQDENGDPIGLEASFAAGAVSNGTLKIILRHLPEKGAAGVSEGDITNAAGETDVETLPAFAVSIQ